MVPKHWIKATKRGRHDLAPIAHLLLRGGTEHVIGTQFVGADSKARFDRMLREYAQEHDAIAIGMLTEAWMARQRPEDPEDWRDHPSIADREDRVEILVLTFDTPYARSAVLWRIEREEGKRARLVREEAPSNVEGRFGGVGKLQ